MIVVKIGGAEGVGYETVCDDAARLIKSGQRVVLVHGGSNETNILAEQLGHPAQFVTSPSGHTSRRTDKRTLEIFQMACIGRINKQLVLALQSREVRALGLSGLDGGLWVGKRKSAIRVVEDGAVRVLRDDYTGTVDRVNAELLNQLLDAGYTPVLSPPGLSEEHEAINVDADRAAARTASALGADTLVILSNVPGLLREFPDESSLIPNIPRAEIDGAIELAGGRMKKKVLAAQEAIDGGVSRVILADARVESPISRALEGMGTCVA
ncbi:MAG: [LysW]-aminoadipate kinase [Phycisphaeraceae bacterium]|nr:[LysW]-aminoadipate kinase [Phycisphaeraceae bacterium]